jgi:AcrR family transcriptional regulator
MSVKGRRQEYSETTRAAIVSAAIRCFTADGFAKASIDAIAEAARVTKGAVYHHFKDKADLFEAAFVAMEERLLAKLATGVAGVDDPWDLVAVGLDVFLAECCQEDFRRIALEEAPVALGWSRWKAIEEEYFLGVATAALEGLAEQGQIVILPGDLTARMVLAATGEAGLALASSSDPDGDRTRFGAVIMQFIKGLRPN